MADRELTEKAREIVGLLVPAEQALREAIELMIPHIGNTEFLAEVMEQIQSADFNEENAMLLEIVLLAVAKMKIRRRSAH